MGSFAGRMAAAVAVLLSPVMASGQMSMPTPMSTFDLMMPVVMNPCPGGRCPALEGKAAKPAARSGKAAPAAPPLSIGVYQSTPALAARTTEALLARLRRQQPLHVDQVARELKRVDYRQSYADSVRADGFRTDSLSDAMAAYALLGWVIVHDQPNTTKEQATGVRRQFAASLAANPQLLARSGDLAEELKLQFVMVASGYLAAKQEGTGRSYAEAIGKAMHTRYGMDLASLKLTSAGFVGR